MTTTLVVMPCYACAGDIFEEGKVPFYVCTNCGLGQMPEADRIQQKKLLIYKNHIEGDAGFAPEIPEEKDHKARLVDQILTGYHAWKGEGDKVEGSGGCAFEAGFGNAFILQALDSKKEWKVLGCDPSQKAVFSARGRQLAAFKGEFDASDLLLDEGGNYTDLAPGTFDLVIAWDSMEHMYDLKEAFSNAAAMLKKGGIFVMHSPNLMSYGIELEHPHWNDPSHLWHMTARSAQLLALDAKIETLKTEAGEVWGNKGYAHKDNFVLWGRKQ